VRWVTSFCRSKRFFLSLYRPFFAGRSWQPLFPFLPTMTCGRDSPFSSSGPRRPICLFLFLLARCAIASSLKMRRDRISEFYGRPQKRLLLGPFFSLHASFFGGPHHSAFPHAFVRHFPPFFFSKRSPQVRCGSPPLPQRSFSSAAAFLTHTLPVPSPFPLGSPREPWVTFPFLRNYSPPFFRRPPSKLRCLLFSFSFNAR